jgi:hypothetical protein
MDEVTRGWRFADVGLEGDGVTIDGIRIWRATWIDTGQRIIVADPRYTNQRYDMHVYRAEADGRTAEFAAGEFSNNVWGSTSGIERNRPRPVRFSRHGHDVPARGLLAGRLHRR